MSIEQIYCTHCTYGTSALEQREGELADRVLGYSARAGSLDRNELRNDYRAIERFLYYYLPSDTPPEDKQRLDAAAAPRRLFFCPAMGKLQMVGQVAYRQYDTAGRLGSYFAHVLFSDHAQGNWSAADCLRLWHAPWVEVDSAEHSYKLPSLETLDQVWQGKTPPISDEAVLDFLHATSDAVEQAASSPQPDGLAKTASGLIDPRWQTVPMQQRIDLLVNTLQGLLSLGPQRRENILLVVEPSVAALVFYGVARLLPKSLAAGLSFSTYEPNAERLPVTLAATTFYDPYTNDVRPDLYRRRGLVINTYQDRISEAGPPPGDFARFIVDRLLEEGWPTVDRLLAAFDGVGAKRPEDLELLSRAHKVSVQIMSAAPPADDGWRKSEVAVRYLQREVQHQLANAPAGWPQLHKLLGTPNHLTVLELIAGERVPAELRLPAQFLLKKFPPERIAELLNSPLVAQPAKLEALAAYVTAHHRLPEGCQLLTADTGRLKPRPPAEALLHELLTRLPEPVLRQLGASIADKLRMGWFGALVDACGSRSSPPLKKAVAQALAELSDGELLDALSRYREPIRRACPPPEPVLAKRLGHLLYELPLHPKSFDKWLSALLEWKISFASPNLAEQRLAEWQKIRGCLLALRESVESAAAGKGGIKNRLRSPPRAEYKPLAEALNRAMPRLPDEFQELHDVAANGQLSVPDFKRRLELAARHTGLSITFGDVANPSAAAGDELFAGPGDEVARLHQRRELQASLQAMFRDLEEQTLVYADDKLGSQKLHVLQQIGQMIVGRPDFLGPGRQMVEAYFSNGGAWSGPVLLSGGAKKSGRKRGKKSGGWQRQIPLMLGVTAGVALLMFVIGHFFLPAPSPPNDVAQNPPTAPPSPHAPIPPATVSQTTPPTPSPKPPAEQPKASPTPPLARPPNADAAPSTKPKNSPAASSMGEDSTGSSPGKAPEPAGRTPPKNTQVPMPESSSAPTPNNMEKKPALPPPAGDDPAPANPSDPKPGPGDPQTPPTETKAVSDTKRKDAPIIVSDYCTLPMPGNNFSAPVAVKTWPDDPGTIHLTLRGLTEANRRLDSQHLRLSAKQNGAQLPIMLEESAGEGANKTLATLTKDENELIFKWVESPESFTAARRQLRRCVVEVVEIADDETSYISLMAPVKHAGPAGLSNGIAKLGLTELKSAEFEFSRDEELRLGRGSVQFVDANLSMLTFGDTNSVVTAASIHNLPDALRDSHARVVLWQNDKNHLDANLHLAADDTALPDGMAPVSDKDRKDLKILRDNIPNLRRLKGNISRSNQKQIANMESVVRALADVLNIKDPPRRAGATPPADVTKYAGEIQKQIIDPAEQRRDELGQQVKAVDEFIREQQDQLKKLTSHANTVTATIYRRVARNLYAPCLLLGDVPQLPDELPSGYGYEVDGEQ